MPPTRPRSSSADDRNCRPPSSLMSSRLSLHAATSGSMGCTAKPFGCSFVGRSLQRPLPLVEAPHSRPAGHENRAGHFCEQVHFARAGHGQPRGSERLGAIQSEPPLLVDGDVDGPCCADERAHESPRRRPRATVGSHDLAFGRNESSPLRRVSEGPNGRVGPSGLTGPTPPSRHSAASEPAKPGLSMWTPATRIRPFGPGSGGGARVRQRVARPSTPSLSSEPPRSALVITHRPGGIESVGACAIVGEANPRDLFGGRSRASELASRAWSPTRSWGRAPKAR